MKDQQCNFCRSDAPKLSAEQAQAELRVVPDWSLEAEAGELKLKREFSFPDFARALVFTNRVGEFAESIGHHPDLLTSWGKVTVVWYTHKIGGVQQGDFLCAIETELLYQREK
ncbi:pterin-4-alpha-carbinolamine dehydratase [Nitrincola sp. A-D6]|uniref:4a-hydroxytetrahydrobiopterin dehydratase n=1 Tax=Nitrincola sp. A-D6 TaxID=1545442 RepID=UPI00051FA433|nr:4a-hydroxytetrahydrobiopterin dehydratase [Nitrincola sp. A-D6]KGK42461.1 pterin-4-alpha-carbinolamine dehydratase [Nitrincola sp. A-D6]